MPFTNHHKPLFPDGYLRVERSLPDLGDRHLEHRRARSVRLAERSQVCQSSVPLQHGPDLDGVRYVPQRPVSHIRDAGRLRSALWPLHR